MEKIELLAKSSSGDGSYLVTFTRNKSGLSINCTCPAGQFGQLCKHKLRLSDGIRSMLFDQGQIDELEQVQAWIAGSGYPELFERLNDLESEQVRLKKEIKDTKAMLGRVMVEGLK